MNTTPLKVRSRYENEEAINDPRTALKLLKTAIYGGRCVGAHLTRFPGECPEIEIMFEGKHGRGGSSNYYLLDPACAALLIKENWVKGTPTGEGQDPYQFEISSEGFHQHQDWYEEDNRNAHSLLVPGVHGWSSIFKSLGVHRLRRGDTKDWKEGHLFVNPADKYFMVFLDKKEVVEIKREECGL